MKTSDIWGGGAHMARNAGGALIYVRESQRSCCLELPQNVAE